MHRGRAVRSDGPRPARAPVAEHVLPLQRRNRAAAKHVAAGDRAPAVVVPVLRHRVGLGGAARAALQIVGALAPAPAEVETAHPRRGVVNLLHRVLPHVADPHVAGGAIEREPPWVAQTDGPDLGAPLRGARERVACGNGVRQARVAVRHVDAEDLRQPRGGVGAVVVGILLAAAIAKADVQHAVGPELQVAAVVIGVGLVLGQHHARGAPINTRGVRAGAELHHAGVAITVGVVDVEAARRGEVRGEGQAQEPLLDVIRPNSVADVEPRPARRALRRNGPDDARLRDHQQALLAGGLRHVQRTVEAVANRGEPDGRRRRRGDERGDYAQGDRSRHHARR